MKAFLKDRIITIDGKTYIRDNITNTKCKKL